jgi:hypothetical protein
VLHATLHGLAPMLPAELVKFIPAGA